LYYFSYKREFFKYFRQIFLLWKIVIFVLILFFPLSLLTQKFHRRQMKNANLPDCYSAIEKNFLITNGKCFSHFLSLFLFFSLSLSLLIGLSMRKWWPTDLRGILTDAFHDGHSHAAFDIAEGLSNFHASEIQSTGHVSRLNTMPE